MKNITISVQIYGDFDIPHTVVTMVGPNVEGIRSILTQLGHNHRNTSETDEIINDLRDLGFITMKNFTVAVGGNL